MMRMWSEVKVRTELELVTLNNKTELVPSDEERILDLQTKLLEIEYRDLKIGYRTLEKREQSEPGLLPLLVAAKNELTAAKNELTAKSNQMTQLRSRTPSGTPL
jgi:hypothetical protein